MISARVSSCLCRFLLLFNTGFIELVGWSGLNRSLQFLIKICEVQIIIIKQFCFFLKRSFLELGPELWISCQHLTLPLFLSEDILVELSCMGNSFDRVHLFVLVDHFSLKLLKQAQVRPLQPLLLLQCFLILKLLELSSYVLFDKLGISFGFATSDHFISLYDLLDHLLVILHFFLIAIFGEKFRRDSHHCRLCEFHLLWNGLVYDAFCLLEG